MMMFQGSNDDDLGKSGQVEAKDTKLIKGGVALEGAEAVSNLAAQYDLIESLTVTVDKSMRGLINTMGQGENLSEGIRKNIADAIPAVIEMGGAVEDVTRINADYTQALGRNVTLTNEQTEGLFAAEKISGKTSKELVDGFANVGMSIKDIGVNMLAVREVANNLGANALAVSREVVGNIQQLNRFNFKDGVEGLARMAAQSSALRVSMQAVFGLAEKVLDPERAIEMSSALQRLGASSSALTDPLRLMDLAQNNVPQLQQELGKMFKQYTMFDEKTKSFKIMPGARLQLKAIADEMGIGIDEAEKYALGAADLGKKLSQISFAGLDVDEDLKTTIANMATMGEGGEYTIKTETGEEMVLQDFLDRYKGDEKGLKEYLDRQQKEEGKSYEDKMLEAQQTMAELAKRQLDEYTKAEKLGEAAKFSAPAAAAGSQYGKELLGLNVQIAEAINRPLIDNFGPKSDLRVAFNEAGEGLKEAAKALESGDYKGAIKIVGEQTAALGLEIVGQIKETLNNYGDIPGIDVLKDKVATGIDELSQTIKDKFPGLEEKLENLKKEIEGWKLPKPNEEEGQTEERRPKSEEGQTEERRPKSEEGQTEERRPKSEEGQTEERRPTSQNLNLNQQTGINVPSNINVEQAGIQLPNDINIETEQLSVTTNNLTNVSALEQKETIENTNQISPLVNAKEVFDQYLALLNKNIGQSVTTAVSQNNVNTNESSSILTTMSNATNELVKMGQNIETTNLDTKNQNTENLNQLNSTLSNQTNTSLITDNTKIDERLNQLNNTLSNQTNTNINQGFDSSKNLFDQSQSLVNNQANLQNFNQTNLNQTNTPTQTQINATTFTQTPLEISEIKSPISVSNFAEFKGEMIYGGEIKVVHTPMEIVVSSKDGKMNGREIGEALTAEVGRNNNLQNKLKIALGDADLGTIKKPQKIRDGQFSDPSYG
jgi:hypothetical protein